MSMHFVSHPWQVQDVPDGTVVTLSAADVRDANLGEDLLELVRESGRPNLYLDLMEVRSLPSSAAGTLFGLDQRLRETGGRLVLSNLSPQLSEALQAQNV